ncbi:AraC family transcriptional regulator [Gordonia sp. TBRC 11910]|uniref:AraC family transcriptional regulator n=1 Tax=Gordonia asplenii TaxID=2725283 RepID=A0A848L821_9ACTN|nr:AraC family transcriptional regulator [Gordonia asplenii]NMO04903.1 AraC family transcriptional regulator [Gordonia asplenii]
MAKPLARYATMSTYPAVAHSVGLDPARFIRDVGLNPSGIAMPDRWVPATSIAELLHRSAVASGHDDFGIALAEQRRLSALGPLSLVIREEPDVRSALRMLMRYEHMYNEALHITMSEADGLATLKLSLDVGSDVPVVQSIDFAIGVLCRLMRDLRGATWYPLSVTLRRFAPHDPSTHHQILGPNVSFDGTFDGLTVYARDLDAPNALSDPEMRSYAAAFLASLDVERHDRATERVRRVVEVLLPSGRCSVVQVARSLGVDRRTVHRQLASEATTFTSVVNDVRMGMARHLVGQKRHSLTEVAELLSFSSPGNFSRWFRTQFGCSPTQWRSRSGDAERAVSGAYTPGTQPALP